MDTSIFKANSVRGASSSVAMSKGVNINENLQTADWSNESIFKRFYYRPQESEYA